MCDLCDDLGVLVIKANLAKPLIKLNVQKFVMRLAYHLQNVGFQHFYQKLTLSFFHFEATKNAHFFSEHSPISMTTF